MSGNHNDRWRVVCRRKIAFFLWLVMLPAGTADAKRQGPALERSLKHPSGAFHVKTPMDWHAESLDGRPDVWQVSGNDLLIRFVYRESDAGFDSLHVACMHDFLLGPMEVDPRIKYEHDFISGSRWERRFLDSAFIVTYDRPVFGHREWRQWNLTVVGPGQSLCIIVHCPLAAWKQSRQLRSLLEDVMDSIEFEGAP
jgi:hypothetical protein